VCCFVLLIPTPEEYRVPRVNPGVTASKLSPPLLPSLATPGPPLPYRPLQKARYYYPRFRVGSSICLASVPQRNTVLQRSPRLSATVRPQNGRSESFNGRAVSPLACFRLLPPLPPYQSGGALLPLKSSVNWRTRRCSSVRRQSPRVATTGKSRTPATRRHRAGPMSIRSILSLHARAAVSSSCHKAGRRLPPGL